jgi:hypothetical protein
MDQIFARIYSQEHMSQDKNPILTVICIGLIAIIIVCMWIIVIKCINRCIKNRTNHLQYESLL